MADEVDEIIQDFLVETQELLDDLDQKFVELEKERENQQLLNDIFRSVHTIKGASGFLGFAQLVDITHKTENVLKKLKEGEMEATPEVMDVILKAVDAMKVLVGHIRAKDGVEEDISGIVGQLEAAISNQQSAVNSQQSASNMSTEAEQPQKLGEILVGENVLSEEQLNDALMLQEIYKECSDNPPRIGEILTKTSEITKDDLDHALEKQSLQSRHPVQEKAAHVEQTIRVDVQRLDNVLNLVGELVLGRNRVMRIGSNFEFKHPDDPEVNALSEVTAFINLITTDLQIAVMKTRMQPVKKVFNRFPRMVRDLARAKGKDVELQIFGEDTELDKSVIEEIGDPLVHLIRNAVDHGIEPPDERERLGKSRVGLIRLSASQEGNNIILEVADDGRGMDTEVLRQKAVEKGILSKAETEKLTDKETLELVFMPGFSTAKSVSDISGRGVGMDVVKTNISKLNGFVDIKTEKRKGTKFIIRLPLTLAIIQALMVEIGNEIFAVPLSNVVETVRVASSDVKTIDSNEVIVLREQLLPLVRLGREFGIASTGNGSRMVYVVVIALGDKRFGLVVDRLQGQEEVVIKPIEGNLTNTEGIAGATITGDGRVVLILDVALIMDRLLKSTVTGK